MKHSKPRSLEHRLALSKALKGNTNCKGRVMSDEHKEKIRQSNLGKEHKYSEEGYAKLLHTLRTRRVWNKGMKGYMAGEKNARWIKDRSKVKRYPKRVGSLYVEFRRACHSRDGYKCRLSNNDCAGKLEVHHIVRWIDHPHLRYDPNNGITLCHFHHPRKRMEEVENEELFKRLIAD